METETTVALSVQPSTTANRVAVMAGDRGLRLTSLDEMFRFARYVSGSGLAPKGIETPEAILVAMQLGAEIGLTPMSSLQNIAVINGRPSVWGDTQLAVCRATGDLSDFEEWFEVGGNRIERAPSEFADTTTAVCSVTRKGFRPSIGSFSVGDAKRAGLWGKNVWAQYPARMLKFRARSFVLRDQFGDALRGLRTAEEESEVIDVTPRVVATVSMAQGGPGDATQEPKASPASVGEVQTTRRRKPTPHEIAPAPAPEPVQAPVSVPEPSPAAAPAPVLAVVPPLEPSAQGFLSWSDQLRDIVLAGSFTFPQLKAWADRAGQEDSKVIAKWTGFSDIPANLAERWSKSQAGLLRGLAFIAKEGK
jgi:hypothetical protein